MLDIKIKVAERTGEKLIAQHSNKITSNGGLHLNPFLTVEEKSIPKF